MKRITKDYVIGTCCIVASLGLIVLGIIFFQDLLKLRIKMDTAVLNWLKEMKK